MTEEAEENQARREDEAEAPDIFGAKAAPPPVDRASESTISPDLVPPQKQTTAISSGPFAVAAASADAEPEHAVSPVSLVPSSQAAPLPVSIASAMGRGRDVVPLSRIIGIGAAIFVVLVGLSLLLFR